MLFARVLFSACLMCAWQSAAAPPSELVFPAATCGWISTANLPGVNTSFGKCSFGRLGREPALAPFLESVRRAKASPLDALEHTSGLSWDALNDVSEGEVAGGVVEYVGEDAGLALYAVLDPASPTTRAVLEGSQKQLLAEGARLVSAPGDPGTQVFRRPSGEVVVHVLGPDYLIAANREDLAATMSERASQAQSAGGLADDPSFQESGRMTTLDDLDSASTFRFFVNLVAMLEVLDDRDAIDEEAGKLTPREEAAKHGYDAVRGVSGAVRFGEVGADARYQFSVLLRTPFEKSMKMVQLRDAELPPPPDWIPANSVSFLTTFWDLGEMVPNLGPLFDDVAGDGIEGTFEDILVDLKADDGPGVDLQQDLFSHLGPRVHIVKQQLLPIGPKSDCDSLMVELDDEYAVADALEALVRDDPTVRSVPFAGRPHALWRMGVPQRDKAQAVRFTTTGLTVANGYFVIATNFDVVRTLLGSSGQSSGLADADDFRTAAQWLLENVGSRGCLRIVSRMNRDVHVTYELARRGKLEDAETIYASLARLAAQEGSGVSTDGPDYSLLPDYEKVESYLGVNGMQGRLHPNGWLFDGAIQPPVPPATVP